MDSKRSLSEIGDTVMLLGTCPDNWHYYNSTNSCFYTSTTKDKQEKVREACQSMAGDLASITDQAEMDFVISIS